MSFKEIELLTKSVDNSVDWIWVDVLSIGFYYIFVKMDKIKTIKLFI